VTTENSLPLRKLRPLAATLAIPIVRETNGNYGPLDGVPTNYVIDRDGVVRYARAGALTLESLKSIVEPLLSEPVTGQ
jgi:cytochrome c biogenesis protein CcmG, thiol:disulfide interchange protein DsbE